ncbi:hypothetical protein [Priestia megaterium]
MSERDHVKKIIITTINQEEYIISDEEQIQYTLDCLDKIENKEIAGKGFTFIPDQEGIFTDDEILIDQIYMSMDYVATIKFKLSLKRD